MSSRPPADAARLAAYDVLVAVREGDVYANLLLRALLRDRGIGGRDAALATELVGGTLRGLAAYDAVIDEVAARAPDPAVRDALRLGVHQVLSMRVPDHAAVATTVELVRTRVGHRPAGFVNAVLRRVATVSLDKWLESLHAPVSVRFSHPEWVVDELRTALGERSDELPALLAADNQPPRVSLVARPGLCDPDELVAAGATRSPHSPVGVVLVSGDPARVPAVAEGRAGVQDEGSQLVALAAVGAPVDDADRTWLDLCAGPGGKAALIGAVAAQRGARLLAGDRQPHRAELVRRATSALPPGAVGVVSVDGTRPAWQDGRFDRVLVDAPCTGLGALRRRPEARWRRTRADLDTLAPLQVALLRSGLRAVRPGGLVTYATCSPVLTETAEVVATLLSEVPDLSLVDARPVLRQVPDCDGPLEGTIQLWPHRHGTDAMFVALLRRGG